MFFGAICTFSDAGHAGGPPVGHGARLELQYSIDVGRSVGDLHFNFRCELVILRLTLCPGASLCTTR